MADLLPKPFQDLTPYLAWALPTERERSTKRQASTMDEITAFFQAMLPRMEEILPYLDQFALENVPEEVQRLFYLTHIFWPLAENKTRWEIRTYSPRAKTLAGRFSQEYGKVSFRDTLLEDGSTLEKTQKMLSSGAKKEIVLQDEELLIRQQHHVIETFLNA